MATLDSLLRVYAIPTGRRLVALRAMKHAAVRRHHTGLVDHVNAALAHNEKTRALELSWQGQRSAPPVNNGEAVRVDQRLDKKLSGLHALLEGISSGELEGQPVEAARDVKKVLFPAGLAAVTNATQEDEATAVRAALSQLKSPAFADRVKALNIGPTLDALEADAGRLLELLSAAPPPVGVTYAQVLTSQARGVALLHEAVARVLGLHPSDSAADTEARAELLEGVLRQGEEFAAVFRRRRGASDVNPDTGEPVQDVVG